ncbi:MBOAT family O-acyltransferase [Methylomonas sp. MK1]|uniref:MBOAT family O-acyltransferase n=1 Tax=Methylomonas sp. MK1 TaxID=1131552 RepID=UPI001F1F6F1E|nr:MBOAT family protein [Methylomonas sp. MK1]
MFLLAFLPITLLLFFSSGKHNSKLAAGVLFFASLVFYGWWDTRYVGLLLTSIVFNFAIGQKLSHKKFSNRKPTLIFGVCVNLAVLGYFKYAGFFLETFRVVTGSSWEFPQIVLPLGISFFTFTQIAFLVDAYKSYARELNIIHYGLFVTYFPHLIAGPVLHHKEMMPQFKNTETYRPKSINFAVGLTIFIIGLFKKVCIADTVSGYSSVMFAEASAGGEITLVSAWAGALAYSVQLYFDFSGYSDMAIGLSRIFGVTLPLNFNSPYKSKNIIEFWRRWHMTLSRFLRDYLYIPLGGSRNGSFARYRNLLVTMLLGGLWHGAGWTFVIWGGLHGTYLIINHCWQALQIKLGLNLSERGRIAAFTGWLITFVAVVIAWVFFRAPDTVSAMHIIKAMTPGIGKILLDANLYDMLHWRIKEYGQSLNVISCRFTPTELSAEIEMWIWIVTFLLGSFIMPNTQEIMHNFKPALDYESVSTPIKWFHWRPNTIWLCVITIMGLLALPYTNAVSEFLYFQF